MIRVYLKKYIDLDDKFWCSREEYEELYQNDIEAFKELLNEDLFEVFNEGGGLEILESSEWVEDD